MVFVYLFECTEYIIISDRNGNCKSDYSYIHKPIYQVTHLYLQCNEWKNPSFRIKDVNSKILYTAKPPSSLKYRP